MTTCARRGRGGIRDVLEQRRIAAELRGHLSTIDAISRAVDDELEAIEALPAALLRRAFQAVEAA